MINDDDEIYGDVDDLDECDPWCTICGNPPDWDEYEDDGQDGDHDTYGEDYDDQD